MSTKSGVIAKLADSLGAPEPAVRLLISLVINYPLAIVYRKFISKYSPTTSHIYFVVAGFLLYIFNYGQDVYHSIISIGITYLFISQLRHMKYLVAINFIFHMSYLLTGYYFTESNDYDIKWTMPHCVLVLRLIGLVYDVTDGLNDDKQLSKDQKETAIVNVPSLLQVAAFSYFPSSFLVGPQFPFRRYENYIHKEYEKYTGCLKSGLIRGGLGVFYLIVRQIGAMSVPDSYFFTKEFSDSTYIHKLVILAIWGKISLYKYISCWLLAEGACTIFGLTFVNIDKDGKEDWSGCSNVKLTLFETATKLGHYVQSFNVNTNHWVAQYVYKRLKFLGNRTISYAAALVFLAIWHGFHTGYYMSFFLEYLIITFERQIESVFDGYKTKYPNVFDAIYVKLLISTVRVIYTVVLMGWCLLPFTLLSFQRWIHIYSLYNYIGYIFLIVWFSGRFIYKKLNKTKRD